MQAAAVFRLVRARGYFASFYSTSAIPEVSPALPEPLPGIPCWDDFRVDGVTLVRSVREAERVAALVERYSRVPAGAPPMVHAWDTEVTDLDLETESPVGHGTVICASFYSGPSVDYGTGPCVWIDALGEEGDAVLRAFGGVLGSEGVRKVWHNYGFDRHVLFNHGINARGFHGDTLHMARLQNTARLDKATGGGYSLAALSRLLLHTPPKTPMLDLFGRFKRKKNGEEGKVRELPHLGHIQRSPDPAVRAAWVGYSTRDAEVTWRLHEHLSSLLCDSEGARWRPEAVCFSDIRFGSINALELGKQQQHQQQPARMLRDTELHPPAMLELYDRVLRPFGECLTDMERAGIRLDLDAIRAATKVAEAERVAVIERFQNWAVSFTGRPELRFLNVHSDMQKAQLLFGLPVAAAECTDAAAPPSALPASHDAGDGCEVDEGELVVDVVEPPSPPPSISSAASGGGGKKRASKHPLEMQAIGAPPVPAASGAPKGRGRPPLPRASAGTPPPPPPPAPAEGRERALSTSSDSARPAIAAVAAAAAGASKFSTGRRDFSSFSSHFSSTPAAAAGAVAAPPPTSRPPSPLAPPLQVELTSSAFIGLDTSTSDSDIEWTHHSHLHHSRSASGEASEGEEGGSSMGSGGSGSGSSSREGATLPLGPTGFQQRTPSPEEDVCQEYEFDTENVEGWVEPGKQKAKKKRPFSIPSLLLPITDRTPKGRASGTAGSIKKLVARPPGGTLEGSTAYKHFVQWGCPPGAAAEAVSRLEDLLTISSIDTIIETFLRPLEASAASSPLSRVHCSLNLNTETGRLSARRPNLQNQPSLERDKFGIRRAFVAPPGQCLIVADYGQLELRVLAHLTRCRSMIEAFKAGGDFHSRTAIGMYPQVRAAVERGEVLLEEGSAAGGSGGGVALLKDKFKEERRKAKILNFSIAYGKTAFGLSKDWGVSLGEAEATVKAWYNDRPEVLEWQCRTREGARRTGKVYTILGRQRDLPGIHTRRTAGHAERAAINTPIQGSAADIVMCAMLKVWGDRELQDMGYRMVLQVHDEIILEGPLEKAREAQRRLVHLMERPFDAPLLVHLEVDSKVVNSWGEVK